MLRKIVLVDAMYEVCVRYESEEKKGAVMMLPVNQHILFVRGT
jgi:hypothetical protein